MTILKERVWGVYLFSNINSKNVSNNSQCNPRQITNTQETWRGVRKDNTEDKTQNVA